MKSFLCGILGIGLLVPPLFTIPARAASEFAPSQEPQQPDKDKQKPKPEPQQQPPPTPQEPKPTPVPNEKKKEPKPDKQSEKKSKEERNQQERSATQNNTQHPHGQRIPDPKFKASFGSQHTFRPQHLQDNRRFQYSGYWFEIVEVWPADWAFDDPCYIDLIGDDYFLFDTFHPGVRILVIVVG